jgi:membrane fusion protein (multidrug efflux system)
MSAELFTQALVEYTTIEKDFERVSRLSAKESISMQDYDHVKAMYDAAKAKVEMMRKNAEIVAPFSGTITEYMVQEGENYFFNFNLDPGYSSTSGILRLMKLDPIQVAVEVNEKELSGLRIGQKTLVTFDATRDSIFTGSVSAIKPVLSSLTHTSTVKIQVSNSRGLLKPGMFAHVRIIMNPVRAVCVPSAAIYRQPGSSDDYVFVSENGKAGKVKCEKLWTDNTWVAVSGITDGREVVTAGREKLHDGSLIEIK